MVSNQEIIDAYIQTGSVWRAAKILGLSGQTVHERLKKIGHELPGSGWTDAEIAELKELANKMTISEIAHRLGRPYNGVALKISRLGIGERFGNKKTKIPRNGLYTKTQIQNYLQDLNLSDEKVTTYARKNGLAIEALIQAIQKHYPDWYQEYCKRNAVKPETSCPYCELSFYPLSHKQIYCSRKCANEARTDNAYFGGRRRETIGLLEGICQLCGQHTPKGLSSHHMRGKENDPDNEHLIALCSGCHQIVTIIGGRKFILTEEGWEALINLAIIRKKGDDPDFRGVYTAVSIDFITAENEHLYQDEEM